ncbi:MAG TPA: hypothetical protein VD997_16985 [Phycisphaerales bacterium]|nr:hypothetical protein [Phycisphaerales bacterium]
MKRQHEKITPDRLIDASIAVLRAVAEVSEELGGAPIYAPDLMGSALQPSYLAEFTRFEIEEATAFLERMDMLPRAKKKA